MAIIISDLPGFPLCKAGLFLIFRGQRRHHKTLVRMVRQPLLLGTGLR